tara:strand:- start:294 stop:458 length:165 start_codon:yes stop_codon:yes gene_type:complete
MGNYFSTVTQQINNPIYKKKYDKFNKFNLYKNEPFNNNNNNNNTYIPSLSTIKE